MIDLKLLKTLCPNSPGDVLVFFAEPLSTSLPAHDINTPRRVASFLSQVIVESAGFTARVENLNYSAAGLLVTFPRYFDARSAALYARLPVRIGSRVYANRMGNGPESTGDGYKYRGKGLIMVTGRNNHQAFADWMKISLDEAIVYLTTVEGAIMGAVWYWSVTKLNALADAGDIDAISRRVNGGTNAMAERHALYGKALALLT